MQKRFWLFFWQPSVPIVIELINTSCENMIDMLLGPIYREDVKHAKDMLSGAVMISLFCGYTAALILIFG